MKMSKKILMVGICLMLASVVIAGCITQSDIKKQNSVMKPPTFKLTNLIGIWLFDNKTNTYSLSINFFLFTENPNNETIQLQLIYLNLVDESGNILVGFVPKFNPNINLWNQIHNEQFNLEAHENITLNCYRIFSKDLISQYFWNYVDSHQNTSISGLYKLNGELKWFESNSYRIDRPMPYA